MIRTWCSYRIGSEAGRIGFAQEHAVAGLLAHQTAAGEGGAGSRSCDAARPLRGAFGAPPFRAVPALAGVGPCDGGGAFESGDQIAGLVGGALLSQVVYPQIFVIAQQCFLV